MRQMKTVRFLRVLVSAVLAAALLPGSAFAAGGVYVPSAGTRQERILYTKWKKVSRVRNCDAAGTEVPLG